MTDNPFDVLGRLLVLEKTLEEKGMLEQMETVVKAYQKIIELKTRSDLCKCRRHRND